MADKEFAIYKEIRSTTYVLCGIAAFLACGAVFLKYFIHGTALTVGLFATHGIIVALMLSLYKLYSWQEGRMYKRFKRYSLQGIAATIVVCAINIFLPELLAGRVQISRMNDVNVTQLISWMQAAVVAQPAIEFIKFKRLTTPYRMFNTTTPYMKEEDKPPHLREYNEDEYGDE